jgi:serine/threonine-protein kinase
MGGDVLERLRARAQERVGTTLRGKYSLDSLLGVGAMAAVYAGTHRNGSRVAVKVLHSNVAKVADLRDRFLREGYIANRVPHPGVVRALDDDATEGGECFLVMELLEGSTLDQRWEAAGHQLPVHEVTALADTLLDVLAAAHDAGIVHRDIKPENLFITTAGELKVLDFGIARLADGVSKTASGQVMGTAEYVAPEQAMGKPREVDGRSDLFSVGAMMFALLSGKPVHEGRTVTEQLVYAATRPARSILVLLPHLHSPLARVIDVALEFEKDKRWPTARDMQAAVRAAVTGIPRGSDIPPTLPAPETAPGMGPARTGFGPTGTVSMPADDAPPSVAIPLPLAKRRR